MEVVIISPSQKNEAEPEIVNNMFEAGLGTFHLRKPRYSTNQFTQYIKQIHSHFHKRIIIHSHHELIFKFDLKGIHFTETHLDRKFAMWWFMRKLRARGKKVIMTRSYKKISEVYNEEEQAYDYYLMGTIYNVLSNEFYSGYYEQGLLAALNTAKKKFIARGGINEKTLVKSHKMGFAGVALNSVIWKTEDPFAKYIEILNLCKQEGIQIE